MIGWPWLLAAFVVGACLGAGVMAVLVRPEDVLREAFDDALEAIEKQTGITAFRGTPPERR